jgi:prepilin-type N-terminal cleavage/methylation domain-containing protein
MKRKGFTLIELLIVVAIIAILAAIAVPNFLEAQVRSKISRVRADERSAATALEAYAVDYNWYPTLADENDIRMLYTQYAVGLTTPVAYTTSADFKDPFSILQPEAFGNTGSRDDWRQTLCYFNYAGTWAVGAGQVYGTTPLFFPKRAYVIFSNGPRRVWTCCEHVPYVHERGAWHAWAGPTGGLDVWCDAIYDASNGTKSHGGIARYGGDLQIPQSL